MKIFLFDVDGVLIEPRAYRSGVTETLRFLCGRVGVKQIDTLLPGDAEISLMESQGIHDVWDMTDIMFSQILLSMREHFLRDKDEADLGGKSLTQKLNVLKASGYRSIRKPNYEWLGREIGKDKEMPHPPDAARVILSASIKKDGSNADQFEWCELLDHFLNSTRSVYENLGTRLFQNIILGRKVFETTYGLPGDFEGHSLLEELDRTLMTRTTAEKVKSLLSEGKIRGAVYTARPSLAPPMQPAPSGYSPEAELAVKMSALEGLPLVGMGTMEWLGKKHNYRTEDLTKPNTTQALSALIAAVTGECTIQTVEEAFELDFKDRALSASSLAPLLHEPVSVTVFEDTISGINPLRKLERRLKELGCNFTLSTLGIANQPSKIKSLEEVADKVFPDVNKAVDHAIAAVQATA